MTELDEIVLVAKMAWALKQVADPMDLEVQPTRWHAYRSHAGVHLSDYVGSVASRLDRKARDSEKHRRALAQTKMPA